MIKFKDLVKILKKKNRSSKGKNLSLIISEIDNHPLTSTIRVRLFYNGLNENVYIINFFMYKQYSIYLNKKYSGLFDQSKNGISNEIRDKDRENKIRIEMKKNYNVTVKELSKLTGISEYAIGSRFYMKIRREIST